MSKDLSNLQWSDERPFDKRGKVLVLCPDGMIMELTIKPCDTCGVISAGGAHLDGHYFDGCKFAFGELPVTEPEVEPETVEVTA